MITEISITWTIDDVKEVCPTLTDEQCSDVLQSVKKYHDAEQGINWDTLIQTAECLFGDSE